MAIISTHGLDELLSDMESVAELPDDVILDMLSAEAEIAQEAQKAEAKALGVYDTGKTAESITFKKKLSVKGSEKAVYVYPQGTRSDGNKRSVSAVAFMNEFGTSSQPARPFINTANERTAQEQENAAARVYDEFLKSKNL